MDSIWKENARFPQFGALEEDIRTQVLIIGGGLTGLLCAFFLKKAGVECVLAEAGRLCGGTTGNTTAKITAQHGLLYDRLIREWGIERADMYLRANLRALEEYRQLCGWIDCRFEEKNAYVFSRTDQGALERELRALEKLRYPARFADDLRLPFSVVGAVCFPHQAQFDPLQFGAAVAAEVSGCAVGTGPAEGGDSAARMDAAKFDGPAVRIFENTRIVGVEGQEALAQNGRRISAEKVIFATHFPIVNAHGLYFLKMYQQRSYVLALEGAQQVEGMYREDTADGVSLRNAGRLLLLGGGGHRTGKCGGGYEALRQFSGKFYPKAREYAAWAAQDCMSLDQIPYIGRYAGAKREWYVATGFNKWGMTSAMAAARILCDMILEKENDCAEVFSPRRKMKKPQLAANAVEAAANLLQFGKKRCPHMGCALHYNSAEHSWDCPCHGSRFSKDGRLLQEPALRGLDVGGQAAAGPYSKTAEPGKRAAAEPAAGQRAKTGVVPFVSSDQPAGAEHEKPEGQRDRT